MSTNFFNKDLFLTAQSSKVIYKEIKDLKIIDYHCHLDPHLIKLNLKLNDIGEMFLAKDHYKWRAMRLCGVDEKYITGNATFFDKFKEFARILPKLLGNPLYYWTHLELQQVFGIYGPLNEDTAEEIYNKANKTIKGLSIQTLLKKYNVEYVATTNDPLENLSDNGTYDSITVNPTFRPDKLFSFDKEYFKQLSKVVGYDINNAETLKNAIRDRLDFFVSKGCKITDHGFNAFPTSYYKDTDVNTLFKSTKKLTDEQKDGYFGWLLSYLMELYKERNLVVQMHFSVLRNVNEKRFQEIGVDSGFDIIGNETPIEPIISFLNRLDDEHRPTIILYSLNPNAIKKLACISGAFRNVHIGAAWWFNDTVEGIKENLKIISEYAAIGTNLGMLTDSRSFTSYSRFDFFRRLLADFIGKKVDSGEYTIKDGIKLAQDISYNNIKNLLEI